MTVPKRPPWWLMNNTPGFFEWPPERPQYVAAHVLYDGERYTRQRWWRYRVLDIQPYKPPNDNRNWVTVFAWMTVKEQEQMWQFIPYAFITLRE